MDCKNIISDSLAGNATRSIVSFLEFPGEIRNKIYKNILGPSRVIHKIAIDSKCPGVVGLGSCSYKRIPTEYLKTTLLDLEIMRTCKQVNSEFASIFFAHYKFKFLCSCNLEDFLGHGCPPEGFQYLKCILVKWDGTWRNKAFQSLLACHNLKVLHLGVDWGTKIRMTSEKFESHNFRRPDKVTYEMADGIQDLLLLAGIMYLTVSYIGMKKAPDANGIWKLDSAVETAEEVSDRKSVHNLLRSKIVRPKTKARTTIHLNYGNNYQQSHQQEERANSKVLSRDRLKIRADFNKKIVEEKKAARERAAAIEQRAIEKKAAELMKHVGFTKAVEFRVAEIRFEEKAAEEKAAKEKKDTEKKRIAEEKVAAEEKRATEEKRAAEEKAAEESLTKDVKAFHLWMALHYFTLKL